MRCVADLHYQVLRRRTKLGFQGDVRALRCCFCPYTVSKSHTPQPRSSRSGLGRYNQMRGKMVAHLHKHHRNELQPAPPAGEQKEDSSGDHSLPPGQVLSPESA